jgi:hypothetical protein
MTNEQLISKIYNEFRPLCGGNFKYDFDLRIYPPILKVDDKPDPNNRKWYVELTGPFAEALCPESIRKLPTSLDAEDVHLNVELLSLYSQVLALINEYAANESTSVKIDTLELNGKKYFLVPQD